MSAPSHHQKATPLFLWRSWAASCTLFLALGALSWIALPQPGEWLNLMAPAVRPERAGLLLAIIFWTLGAGILVGSPFGKLLFRCYDVCPLPSDTSKGFTWPGIVMGVAERTLYLIAFLMRRPELVPLWIGLKTAGSWGEFRERGRHFFEIYLLGSLLSAGIASIGYAFALVHVLDRSAPGRTF